MRTKLLSIAAVLASVSIVFPVHADSYNEYNSSPAEKWRGCYMGARTPAIIKDYKDEAIMSINRQSLTTEQVRQAIVRAAGKNKWTIDEKAGGRLEATLLVRNKHTIAVEILYTAAKFSLFYKNSVNMNYAACEGEKYIHRNYNVWVANLKNASCTSRHFLFFNVKTDVIRPFLPN